MMTEFVAISLDIHKKRTNNNPQSEQRASVIQIRNERRKWAKACRDDIEYHEYDQARQSDGRALFHLWII